MSNTSLSPSQNTLSWSAVCIALSLILFVLGTRMKNAALASPALLFAAWFFLVIAGWPWSVRTGKIWVWVTMLWWAVLTGIGVYTFSAWLDNHTIWWNVHPISAIFAVVFAITISAFIHHWQTSRIQVSELLAQITTLKSALESASGPRAVGLTIENAQWAPMEEWKPKIGPKTDMTERIRKYIQNGPVKDSIDVEVSTKFLGEPGFGERKYLWVTYSVTFAEIIEEKHPHEGGPKRFTKSVDKSVVEG